MLKLISRASALARIQVEELKSLLPTVEFDTSFIASGGDKDLETSLLDGTAPENFFTDTLDQSILSGAADVAVHSAKDLVFPLPVGLTLAALTVADDKTDSLVSRDNLTLAELPQNAKVGTSSPSRRTQLLALRPDIEIVSIRGDIGQRIAYVDRGEVDAVIVATCALKRLGLKEKIAEKLPFITHDLQGNLAVVVKDDRYDLQALFSVIDSRKKFGRVTLVGAGPGNPDLMTRKGERKIRKADIVFYDALLDDEILTWITGEKIFVGKRKGEHYCSQDEINRMLYEAASVGKRVVRLKCGDPLLFSRGGEEIDYLASRHIPVSVVPGVSSFQGCAASLKMPLTQRGLSRSLTALSAHYEKPREIPVSSEGTQVIFMGASKVLDLQEALRQKGWDDSTPIAVISRGTYADEQVFPATVANLHTIEAPAPAMIIVGEVSAKIHPMPKVLFTGLDPSRAGVKGKMVHQPLIELVPIDAKLSAGIELYEGFIFTSRAAVNFFCDRWEIPRAASVVAVGPHTAHELTRRGVTVTSVPKVFDSTHLAESITKSGVGAWLYPCSNISNNPIHEVGSVQPFPIYETQLKEVTPLVLTDFSAILFSSPSTVDAFLENYGALPDNLQFLVYGEPSAKKLESVGVARGRIVIWPIRVRR